VQASPVLVVIQGPGLGRTIPLEPGQYTIGRTAACDIHLEGHGISRRHARLSVDAELAVVLEDTASTNGTYVRGKALQEPTSLEIGATFQLGPLVLKLLEAEAAEIETGGPTPLEPGTDPLTSLANRELARRQLEWAMRDPQRRPLSVLLFDVDGLKVLNERHGYAFGDELLIAISRAIESRLREGDLLASYGAGTWLLLADQMGLGSASELGETIRRVVATMERPRGVDERVTVSVGVATFDAQSGPEREALPLVASALREAKGAGGNRVCVRGPGSPS